MPLAKEGATRKMVTKEIRTKGIGRTKTATTIGEEEEGVTGTIGVVDAVVVR